jgi:hypothetical protein
VPISVTFATGEQEPYSLQPDMGNVMNYILKYCRGTPAHFSNQQLERMRNALENANRKHLWKRIKPPLAAGDPHGYVGPAAQHVVYRSTAGDIVELFVDSTGNWVHNVINQQAGAPTAGGSPRGYIDNAGVHHVVYRSTAGDIVELFVDSTGNWVHNVINQQAGAPAGSGDPHGYVGPAAQHVVYRSTAGDIVELFVDSTGNWVHNVLTMLALVPTSD